MVGIIARRMEDGDADDTVGVDWDVACQYAQDAIATKDDQPFGCQMSQRNFMVGGMSG